MCLILDQFLLGHSSHVCDISCFAFISFQLFYFSELTDEMEEQIALWLRAQPSGQVLIDKFRLQITRQDVATLAGLNWLNDEVSSD